MAVASVGPYASLHLAPDRLPRQHPTTQFFTGRMPFLPPNQQRQSSEGHPACRKLSGVSLAADEVRAVLAGRGERGEDVRGHRRDADVGGTDGGLCRAYVRRAPRRHCAPCQAVSLHDVARPRRAAPRQSHHRIPTSRPLL